MESIKHLSRAQDPGMKTNKKGHPKELFKVHPHLLSSGLLVQIYSKGESAPIQLQTQPL